VDWFTEKPCFESFLKELALFYTPEPLPPREEDSEDSRRDYLLRSVEMVLFPELRRRFIAVKTLVNEKRVVEVADLPGLYRIFERC
jgi:DNA mismatch repair protein MLH1